ncbi:hypothetical protein SMD22_02040 (plasmid) [Brevibacillus halotolerans]|nr:hypothetical protein SMD22_02040 [Brevibacillus halotolerans]
MSKAFEDKMKRTQSAREKLIKTYQADVNEKDVEDVSGASQADIQPSTINQEAPTTIEPQNDVKWGATSKNEEIATASQTHTDTQESRGEIMATAPTNIDPIMTEPQPIAYKPKKHKKKRLIDTHEQKSYYIEKEIVEIIEEIVGDDTGGKYRFVNEALKLLIYQEYPEYAQRIKIRE